MAIEWVNIDSQVPPFCKRVRPGMNLIEIEGSSNVAGDYAFYGKIFGVGQIIMYADSGYDAKMSLHIATKEQIAAAYAADEWCLVQEEDESLLGLGICSVFNIEVPSFAYLMRWEAGVDTKVRRFFVTLNTDRRFYT